MDNQKRFVAKLAAAFFGAVLFLTFFSNTIIALNMPGVVVGEARLFRVTTTHRSFGEAEFATVNTLFAQDGGRISFALRPGDRFGYGDVLFTIEVDRQELLDQLEAEQSRLQATLINIERMLGDLAFEELRLESLSLDVPPAVAIHPPDTTRFEHEARRLAADIERAVEDYLASVMLYEAGGISRSQLDDAARRLELLRESYLRNSQEMGIILQNHARAVADASQAHQRLQRQIRQSFEMEQSGIIHRIENLGYSIRLLEMEEEYRRRSLRRLQDQVEADGIATVYAKQDGIVRFIPAGLEDGLFVQPNQIVMRYAPMDYNRFTVIADFPERIGRIPSDSRVSINIIALHHADISGEIVRTTAIGGRLQLEIEFETTVTLQGGEMAEVILEQMSNAPLMDGHQVLPNSAIRRDGIGQYVLYVVREPNTLIGYGYYARQARILVWEFGDRYASFMQGEAFYGPVVIQSDRPFTHGDRVRIVGDDR